MDFNNLTLDEINSLHKDNYEHLSKSFIVKEFKSISEARVYRMHCMSAGLNKLNVYPEKVMMFAPSSTVAAETIDNMLKVNDVRVESYASPDAPLERHGIYIYHANEIVYYISLIRRVFHNGLEFYEVRTNVSI